MTLAPPLIVDTDTIDEIVEILSLTMSEMEKDFPVDEPFNEPAASLPYVDADWWRNEE